jgi:hypothetical protein
MTTVLLPHRAVDTQELTQCHFFILMSVILINAIMLSSSMLSAAILGAFMLAEIILNAINA